MCEKFLMRIGFEWVEKKGRIVFTDGVGTDLEEDEAKIFFLFCDTISELTKDNIEDVVYRVLHGKER